MWNIHGLVDGPLFSWTSLEETHYEKNFRKKRHHIVISAKCFTLFLNLFFSTLSCVFVSVVFQTINHSWSETEQSTVFTQHNTLLISNPSYKGSVRKKMRIKEVRISYLNWSKIQVTFIFIWRDVKFADIST
jgi:hypothetical protein